MTTPPVITVWGIDPGQTGALCILHGDNPEFIDFTSPKDVLDAIARSDFLAPDLVLLEQISKAPRDSAQTATIFLHNSGWWRGVLDALDPPWALVHPRTWQAFHRVPSKASDPTGALSKARALFPGALSSLARKKDHNRADALLIAAYARHLVTQNKHISLITQTKERREA